MQLAEEYCALSFRPGVAFIVTPPVATTVVCPDPIWTIFSTVPMGYATEELSGIVRLFADPTFISISLSLSASTVVYDATCALVITVDPANSIAVVPSPTYSLSAVESKDILPAPVFDVAESDSVGVVTVALVSVSPATVVTVAPDAIDVEPSVGGSYPETVPQEVEVPSVVRYFPVLPD